MGRRRAVKASAGGGVRNLACTAPVGSSAPVGARGLLDLGVVGRRDSRGYNLALLGRERDEVHDQTIASSKHLVLMPKISEQLARSLYGAPAASGAVAAFTLQAVEQTEDERTSRCLLTVSLAIVLHPHR